MPGSPPASSAALPSFSFLDDAGSRASRDHDFLPAWSRGLSTSPKLTATRIGGDSILPDVHGSGLELFGADILMKDLEKGLLQVSPSRPNVGIGLSPILAPNLLATSPVPPLHAPVRSDTLGDVLGNSLEEAGIAAANGTAFDSAFKKYKSISTSDDGAARPSLAGRALSLDSTAPLSFANVAALPSISPDPHSNLPYGLSSAAAATSASLQSPALLTPKVEEGVAFAQGLPSGLERRATKAAGPGQDTSRIQAYAKLEFPSFDIYIQKLSVTIGRRPASMIPTGSETKTVAPVSAQLADYILGLGEPTIKREETPAAAQSGTQTSVKGKEKAGDQSVEELSAPCSPADQPSASPASCQPVASTSAASVLAPPAPQALAVDSPAPASTVTDVDLGPIRAVSRQHARLYFEFDVGAWVIEVLGRNGVVVEGKWRAKGQKVLLTKKSKIQIAERIFYFVLPTVDAPEVGTPAVKKSKSRIKEKGKGKATAGDDFSGVSEDEIALRARSLRTDVFAISAHKAETATPAPVPPSALSTLPPLPAFTGSVSPSSVRSPSLSLPPAASPGPSAPPSLDLPPLPSKAPVTRGSTKPKPPLSKPKSHIPVPTMPEQPDEYTLELGRQRAAMIAQILSGQVSGSSGKSALVKAAAAAAVAHRRHGARGGKGKGAPPPPGKGLGKGKGIPARARRPSWADEPDEEDEDDSDSASSSSSGSDDSDDGDGMELDGGNMAGGMKSVRATPVGLPAPPSVPESPYMPRKTPAKQPKKQRDLAIPEAYMPKKSPASSTAPSPAAPASPAPPAPLQPTPSQPISLPSNGLPSIPGLPSVLPALPPFAKPGASPAPSSASPSKSSTLPSLSLPSLPAGKANPSPVTIAPLPSAAAPSPSQPVAAILSGKKPQVSKKGVASAAVAAASPDGPPSPAAGTDGKPLPSAKPRPSPYTPAAPPLGGRLLEAAPADDRLAKPPYTYASLIAQALNSAVGKKLTLHQVYDWILARWPYFKENQSGWQSSVRHNLTPQRGFIKIARRADEPGKGSFWQIDPSQLANFDGHHFRSKKPDGAAGSPAEAPSPTLSAASPALAPAPGPAPPPAKFAAAAAASPAVTPGSARPSPSPAPTASTSSAPANTALNKPLPIVVGPIPASYVRPTQPPQPSGGAATDELTTALLKDPPIVLHEGTLILNPVIFAHLTEEQLGELRKKPASVVLAGLQKEVVAHFKEKMRRAAMEKAQREKKAAKGAKVKKGSKASKAAAAAAVGSGAASSSASPSIPPVSPAPSSAAAPTPSPAAPPAPIPVGIATKAPKSKRARPSDAIDLYSTSGSAAASSAAPPPAKVAKMSGAAGGKKK
ncbi:hypothetical protein JCM11251_005911 [Rhodosporidiobolus azoricus]